MLAIPAARGGIGVRGDVSIHPEAAAPSSRAEKFPFDILTSGGSRNNIQIAKVRQAVRYHPHRAEAAGPATYGQAGWSAGEAQAPTLLGSRVPEGIRELGVPGSKGKA